MKASCVVVMSNGVDCGEGIPCPHHGASRVGVRGRVMDMKDHVGYRLVVGWVGPGFYGPRTIHDLVEESLEAFKQGSKVRVTIEEVKE